MLPASGEISIGSIYNELTGAYPGAYSDRSINACEAGTYGAINQNSASKPDGATPNSFAEWYSYNHSAAPSKARHQLSVYTDGVGFWAATDGYTETSYIRVYIYYYDSGYNLVPGMVTIQAGNVTSNTVYPGGGFVDAPYVEYLNIGGTSYYINPGEGPTYYWEWV